LPEVLFHEITGWLAASVPTTWALAVIATLEGGSLVSGSGEQGREAAGVAVVLSQSCWPQLGVWEAQVSSHLLQGWHIKGDS